MGLELMARLEQIKTQSKLSATKQIYMLKHILLTIAKNQAAILEAI